MNSRTTKGGRSSPSQIQNNHQFNQDNFFNDFNFGDFERFDDPFEYMFQQLNIPRLGFGPSLMNFSNNPHQSNHNRLSQSQSHTPNQNPKHPDFAGQLMAMKGSGPGTFLSKAYVSRINYNQNGQPEKETYQSQSINHFGQDGHKIQERQEAYKNSGTGMEKAAKQRMFDDRGHKYIKERNRNTGEQNEHNIFKGMEENQLGEFDSKFNDYKKSVNFDGNYRMLNEMKAHEFNGRRLGLGQGQGNQNGNGERYNQPQQLGYDNSHALPQPGRRSSNNTPYYNNNGK